jgi:hypothetical protein
VEVGSETGSEVDLETSLGSCSIYDLDFPKLENSHNMHLDTHPWSDLEKAKTLTQIEHKYCTLNTDRNRYLTYQVYKCPYQTRTKAAESPKKIPSLEVGSNEPLKITSEPRKLEVGAQLKVHLLELPKSLSNESHSIASLFTANELPISSEAKKTTNRTQPNVLQGKPASFNRKTKYTDLPDDSSRFGKLERSGKQADDWQPHSKKRCLLIHDSALDHFDQSIFPSQFSVTSLKAKSISALQKEDNKLEAVISKNNPECIYIHLGSDDLSSYRRQPEETTVDMLEDLLLYLLENTTASICYSLVIPTNISSSVTNVKINSFNYEATKRINFLRDQHTEIRSRLFSYINDSLSWHNKKATDGYIQLNASGKSLIWRKVEDGLKKTLRLPRNLLANKNATVKRATNSLQHNHNKMINE